MIQKRFGNIRISLYEDWSELIHTFFEEGYEFMTGFHVISMYVEYQKEYGFLSLFFGLLGFNIIIDMMEGDKPKNKSLRECEDY